MIQQLADWLAGTWLSQAFANANWFVPTVQTVHILCIGVVVTALGMLDFRLLHLTRRGPPAETMAVKFVPWVWRALVVLLFTGILLTITEPNRELMNGAFRLKMFLVVLLIVLTLIVQKASAREPGYWSASLARRRLGMALGIGSLVLCLSIVAAGRLIAYL
ncbi:MAG TPA: DUF6644 family protein [Steroidobacteraceae bacterium]